MTVHAHAHEAAHPAPPNARMCPPRPSRLLLTCCPWKGPAARPAACRAPPAAPPLAARRAAGWACGTQGGRPCRCPAAPPPPLPAGVVCAREARRWALHRHRLRLADGEAWTSRRRSYRERVRERGRRHSGRALRRLATARLGRATHSAQREVGRQGREAKCLIVLPGNTWEQATVETRPSGHSVDPSRRKDRCYSPTDLAAVGGCQRASPQRLTRFPVFGGPPTCPPGRPGDALER